MHAVLSSIVSLPINTLMYPPDVTRSMRFFESDIIITSTLFCCCCSCTRFAPHHFCKVSVKNSAFFGWLSTVLVLNCTIEGKNCKLGLSVVTTYFSTWKSTDFHSLAGCCEFSDWSIVSNIPTLRLFVYQTRMWTCFLRFSLPTDANCFLHEICKRSLETRRRKSLYCRSRLDEGGKLTKHLCACASFSLSLPVAVCLQLCTNASSLFNSSSRP